MLRSIIAILLSPCLTSSAMALAVDGTVTAVSPTGFAVQTSKGPKQFKFGELQLKGTTGGRLGKGYESDYRLRAGDFFEGMEVHVDYQIDGVDLVCRGARPHDAELNFAPLAKADGKYTLQVKIVSTDGQKVEQKYEIEAGTSVTAVRDLVLKSLQPSPTPKDHWVAVGRSKNYLEIDGYLRDGKFSMVEKLEVSCDLKGKVAPRVRQRNQPWPP